MLELRSDCFITGFYRFLFRKFRYETDNTRAPSQVVVIGQELADGNFDLVINVSLPTKRKSRRAAQGVASFG